MTDSGEAITVSSGNAGLMHSDEYRGSGEITSTGAGEVASTRKKKVIQI